MQVFTLFGAGAGMRHRYGFPNRHVSAISSSRTSYSGPVITASLILLAIFFSSCKTAYTVADFDSRTAQHKTIAVLPFEMIFTGTKPEKLTTEDMEAIAEAESKAFMISFHDEILRSTKGGRKAIRVEVQHYNRTVSLLDAHDIDIRTAWNEDPAKLAKLLGVDAVVKARIQKHRLMSDLASYGIDVGVHILNVLTNYSGWFWVPSELSKTNDIKASFSLIDPSGSTLWSIAFDEDADWNRPANEIIDGINRRAAKKFPYRR